MDFEITGIGSLDPRQWYNRGREELNEAITNATVTVSGIPDIDFRTPGSVTVGGDGTVSTTPQAVSPTLWVFAAAVVGYMLVSKMGK